MAEYGSMLTVSLLASILFLGGWNGPLPITEWLGLGESATNPLAWYVGSLLGVINLLLKGTVGVSVMMWVRWTLPRLRIDQVMATCLKYCVPIAAVMFLGAAGWRYRFPDRVFFGLLPAPAATLELSERWVDAPRPETAPASHFVEVSQAEPRGGPGIAPTASDRPGWLAATPGDVE